MAREIELKLPLSDENYSHLISLVKGKAHHNELVFENPSHIIKSDEYYSLYKSREERKKNKELKVIRIRSEKNESLEPSGIDIYGDNSSAEKVFFTIKEKTCENGVEFNSEYESLIEEPQVLRKFFSATGYICWFKKVKDSFSTYCSFKKNPSDFQAHLEVESVNGHKYIEIEYTKDDLSADLVRKNLENILLALNLNPEDRDSRSWPEILGQK
ncbi:MAG: hypothetical protein K5873_12425 [Treponema sp.]|nr:hypothetical protein [Treponema sp.]